MNSPHNRKAQAGGPGLPKGKNRIQTGPFFLANFRHRVNEIHINGLLFGRDLLLAGLACLGWPSRRLSLWVDFLQAKAEELREQQGGRV